MFLPMGPIYRLPAISLNLRRLLAWYHVARLGPESKLQFSLLDILNVSSIPSQNAQSQKDE